MCLDEEGGDAGDVGCGCGGAEEVAGEISGTGDGYAVGCDDVGLLACLGCGEVFSGRALAAEILDVVVAGVGLVDSADGEDVFDSSLVYDASFGYAVLPGRRAVEKHFEAPVLAAVLLDIDVDLEADHIYELDGVIIAVLVVGAGVADSVVEIEFGRF